MGKSKKQFQEKLQEVREHHSDKLRYRRRVQDEQEAEKQLKDYEDRKSERRAD